MRIARLSHVAVGERFVRIEPLLAAGIQNLELRKNYARKEKINIYTEIKLTQTSSNVVEPV